MCNTIYVCITDTHIAKDFEKCLEINKVMEVWSRSAFILCTQRNVWQQLDVDAQLLSSCSSSYSEVLLLLQ